MRLVQLLPASTVSLPLPLRGRVCPLTRMRHTHGPSSHRLIYTVKSAVFCTSHNTS